ncbi:MAG TPA: RdgB/HAM1 family non-canonical purine NTP pyrophosphatase [Terriglobia bacterium]|nr:RdgB/HAM1 family non-canonical purine NTP pyrophosphatase [Terriglobia bacterium]
MKRLVVASTNAGKIREVSLALSDLPDWNVESLPDLTEIEETGNSFLENATLKAVHYSRAIPALTLADDSGLCVSALDGRPGLHSARYAPTTHERNDKLLAELAGLGDQVDRRASFYCAFAVAQAGTLLWTVETELQGSIAQTPRGDFGFGYDPIFVVTDRGLTLAEMSSADKNAISARGQALRKLRDFLQLH